MRTVELLPDPALETRIRLVWERLRLAGLPSLARHPHPTNRPHLTLAAAESLTCLPDLDLPLPVTLDGVHLFAGRAGVLVWCVLPTPELRALQAQVFAALEAPGAWYAPGSWTPHVSLALRIPPGQRAAALDLLADLGGADGQFVGARSYDTVTRTTVELA